MSEEKLQLGKRLFNLEILRTYRLAQIAGKLGRAHIRTEELKQIQDDNLETDTEIYNRFVY